MTELDPDGYMTCPAVEPGNGRNELVDGEFTEATWHVILANIVVYEEYLKTR